MIDYQRIIDRMQSQPIPPTTPRISESVQVEIGEYFWAVSHAFAASHTEAETERAMSSSFHVVLLGWNLGNPATLTAESLSA